jgi:hypothetical protein
MACVLSNLQSQCQQFGAIVRAYVAAVDDIDSVVFDANDQITTLDLLYYNTFAVLTPESLDATTQTLNVLTRDDRSAPARWTHTVDTSFLGTSVAMRAAIASLVDCCDKLFAVVETANGDRFVLGLDKDTTTGTNVRPSIVPLTVASPNGVNFGTVTGSGVVTALQLTATTVSQAFMLDSSVVLPTA